jgi:hypothetical protein
LFRMVSGNYSSRSRVLSVLMVLGLLSSPHTVQAEEEALILQFPDSVAEFVNDAMRYLSFNDSQKKELLAGKVLFSGMPDLEVLDEQITVAGVMLVVNRPMPEIVDMLLRGELFRGNSTAQRLGWRLAAGDLTGDSYADLLAGARATKSRGMVNMFAGGASGISFADSTSQAGSSSSSASNGDRYSMGLAVVDIDGDGIGEAAVGVPREDFAGTTNAGAVHVYEITGGQFGAETYYTQADSSIAGSPATGANFGQALAAGSDGTLFVGAPGGTAGTTSNAGMVAPL